MTGEPTTPESGDVTNVVPESYSYGFCHELTEDCPCGPTIEPVQHEDGSINWLYIHHSLDGREASE